MKAFFSHFPFQLQEIPMFIRPWPALALFVFVACAPPRAELLRPTPDPADPAAPEAAIPPASKTLAVSLQAPIPLARAPPRS